MTCLITGITGTIGRAVLRAVHERNPEAVVRGLSRDDSKQTELTDEYASPHWLRLLIGDIRDLDRLRLAFRGVESVVHCAALKHVGACERNPAEAMETNARGTANVIQAATEAGVKRLVLVSTDKAADPSTTLGASKLMAERIVVDSAKWSPTVLTVARLGNVWNSRGSLPQRAWAAVKAGRRIQVTDLTATRYVVTAERAGAFIHDVLIKGETGRIYVPVMERITVLAMLRRAGIRDEAIGDRETIGLQPGEKHDEEIVSSHEFGNAKNCPVPDAWVVERKA